MLQKLVQSIASNSKRVSAHKKRIGTQTVNHYEKLEPRTVLSTFLVQNLSDRGDGSLRAAIEQSNSNPGADVIRFQRGLQGTIALTSGQLEVTDALRIQGPGESSLTISGNSLSRVFKVNTSSGEVCFRGFTIADGLSKQPEAVGINVVRGGGILNLSSQLRVQDLTFRNNRADDQGNASPADVVGGGAIVNTEHAVLQVTRCNFIGNSAAGGTRYAFGGAIASVTSSQAFIQNSVFTNNQVNGGEVNYGGAVAAFGGSSSEVVRSEFVSNKAVGAGTQNAFGGALAARPGTVQNSGSQLVALDCRFSENVSQTSAQATAGGGAIYSIGSNFTLQRSKLQGNLASGGYVSGGGVYSEQSIGVVMNSQLKSNQSIGLHDGNGHSFSFGGGIASSGNSALTVSKSVLELNEARGVKAFGGGIFNGDVSGGTGKSSLTIDRSSVSQNRVATTLASSGSRAQGGGIFNGNPEESQASNATVTATRTKIEKNSAIAESGGQGIGGGVYTVGKFTVDRRLQRQLIDGLAGNFATTSNDNVFGELTLA
jgi:hypothetical protein